MSITIKKKKYEIKKELGLGGFGRVIQVLNKSDKKYYAIKEIKIKENIKDKIKNVENEANILSKFNCKNIVKYYDSYKVKDKFYILMEYCGGENLKDFINKNKYKNELIDENILYNIIKQICTGLKEIHKKNIIHRDIKPENIFMNDKMDIKIGDLGISKYFGSNKEFTKTIYKAGSIYYMAPEIRKKFIYNEKSDMYSLGCIIYELFHLSTYYDDKFDNEIKKIDNNIYNSKWQEIINSLLQNDYKKRMDIDKVYNILLNEIKINELENKINNININNVTLGKSFNNKNIILGEIYINKYDINKEIQILNSFENVKRKHVWINKEDNWKYENEKEIKENTQIKINEEIIEFTYNYKFKIEGKYKIEFTFKNNLTKTDYMFWDCNLLINLDLSKFNTHYVTNMHCMFVCYNSLRNINLSNLNAQNVMDMSHMFFCCKSLTNLDLSNFNALNVINMSYMFSNCESLTNLNLSNINTHNATDMSWMFSNCKSLINLNISNFDIHNVTDISWMFYNCKSLTNLNLSNFNNKKIINMDGMFYGCESLINLNLLNFDIGFNKYISDCFFGCESLTKNGLITKDEQILIYLKE